MSGIEAGLRKKIQRMKMMGNIYAEQGDQEKLKLCSNSEDERRDRQKAED